MTEAADRMLERVLVLRCQVGDRLAFAELIGLYDDRLRRFVSRLLARPAQVEDVLQDIWLDVYRGIGRLADAGALRSWLYRISRARVYRVLRRSRIPAEPLTDAVPVNVSALDDMITTEELAALGEELAELSPPHREVLLLRFVEDFSYEEIAHATGVPVGTVRSRLHHAKSALRARLMRGMD